MEPPLNDASFINSEMGVAVGENGTIIKTTDGGNSWEIKSSGTISSLTSVSFSDLDNGIIVGTNYNSYLGIILRTTDGGNNWIVQKDSISENLNKVSCLDINKVIAVGSFGAILRSTDAGLTWNHINSGTNQQLLDITFANINNGIIVGINGTILKTTDGGINWTDHSLGTTDWFYGVSMVDSLNGVIVGSTIQKTTDGGLTWTSQELISSNLLLSVSFTDMNNGWIVGAFGTILHTTNGGVTFIEDEENNLIQPKEFLLQQNYPNPFNPSTSIQYTIGSLPTGQAGTQFVTLKVYDLLGREVATLVDEEKAAGNYEINFQSTVGSHQLANGVYFYQLRVGDYIETKKMLLLK